MGEYDQIKDNKIKSLKPLRRGTSKCEYDQNWIKLLRRLTMVNVRPCHFSVMF